MSVPSRAPARALSLIALALTAATLLALGAAAPAGAKTIWLCKPGLKDDPCTSSRTATVVRADGTTSVEADPTPKKTPPIDCFYVYPTVSGQPGPVANRVVEPIERGVAIQQASRFSSQCRVFAPMYRQLTITGISTNPPTPAQAAEGPADVLAAWQDYLKHDNHGRGVVFIGHSQGSFVLKAMLAKVIDGNAKLRKRLVSALLIGGNVTVPAGKDVGGQFKHIPACRRTGQTGCVVAYSTFDTTPPANAKFGRAAAGFGSAAGSKLEILCTNPARLAGGSAPLQAYLPGSSFPGGLTVGGRVVPAVSTPWVTYPGRYTGSCRNQDGAQWLQVDHRADDGRPLVTPNIGADWGLHLYDVNLALGNLVDVVHAQAAAYVRGR